MPKLTCSLEGCNKRFYRSPSYLKKIEGDNIYCSMQCRSLGQKPKIKCCVCNKTFRRDKSAILSNNLQYCSNNCKSKGTHYLGKSIQCNCSNCGKSFKRDISRLKHENTFCSFDCYAESERLYPNTMELRRKIYARNYIQNLRDSYIKKQIVTNYGLDNNLITNQLIQLKRKQIKLHRLNNEKCKRST